MLAKLLRVAIVALLSFLRAYERRNERYAEAIDNILSTRTHKHALVLDVGCGSGALSRLLSSSWSVTGVDHNFDRLRARLPSCFGVILATAEQLPLRGECVDAVVAVSLIEHLEKPSKFFRETERILTKDGVVILQIPELRYYLEPHTKWPLLSKWKPSFQKRVLQATGYTDLDLKMTIERLQEIVAGSGLHLVSVDAIWHSPILKLLPMPPGYFVTLQRKPASVSPNGEVD